MLAGLRAGRKGTLNPRPGSGAGQVAPVRRSQKVGSPLLRSAAVTAVVPHADAEVIPGCRHCPPATPEFRAWLADRLTAFFAR